MVQQLGILLGPVVIASSFVGLAIVRRLRVRPPRTSTHHRPPAGPCIFIRPVHLLAAAFPRNYKKSSA